MGERRKRKKKKERGVIGLAGGNSHLVLCEGGGESLNGGSTRQAWGKCKGNEGEGRVAKVMGMSKGEKNGWEKKKNSDP